MLIPPLTASLLALMLGAALPEGSPADRLPVADGISWSSLRLEARKGLLRGTVDVTVRRVDAATALADLRPWPAGAAREPDGDVLVFETLTDATFRGRASRTTWADARGLLQDDGREGRRRSVRRFGSGALVLWRDRGAPRASAEERRVDLVAPDAVDRPVVDFASILWMATARRLDREGSSMRVAVVSKGRLIALDLTALETGELTVGRPPGSRCTARRVRIAAADPEHESSILGMRGDIDLWLDTATGLPVELHGHVAKLGHVRVRVTRAVPAGAS